MNTPTRRDPLAGTRPTFMPDSDAPIDPDRRDRVLQVIFDSPRPARQPFPRRRFGLAAVAAGVVAAVVIGITPGADPPDAQATPRDVLLAAAEAVAGTDVPTSGRYWYVHMRDASVRPYPAGPGHGPYLLVLEGDNETWDSRTGAEKSIGVYNNGLTGRPVRPADEVEWNKAGGAAAEPGPDPQPMAQWYTGESTHTIAGERRPTDEVLALPTDAAQLKAYLLERLPADEVGGEGEAKDENEWLAWEIESLLYGIPTTQGTRAAAYRLLADLPGFRVMDAAELPAGSYVGLARTAPSRWDFVVENGQLEHQLIIDPDTGTLHTRRTVVIESGTGQWELPAGTVLYTTTVLHSGWSDTEPVVPPNAVVSPRPY